jgi:oligoendopeptidase F
MPSLQWSLIEPYYKELCERTLDSLEALQQWLLDRSELESYLEEDAAWRYINMTRDTTNQSYTEAYQFFVNEIQPKIAPYQDKLNRKMAECEYVDSLNTDAYKLLVRNVKKDIELFREENIPIQVELQNMAQEYSAISASLTIEVNGVEKTLQQAAVHLLSQDRAEREQVFNAIGARRLKEAEKLGVLFYNMVAKRTAMAKNAGFDNFRDYMFKSLGRFDYTPEDCFRFHKTVAEQVVPLSARLLAERKTELGLDSLKPFDLAVDTKGRPPLKAFDGGNDLLKKGIACFDKVDTFLGDCLRLMVELKRFDLESRKGKAPGGYNYPLDESGVPFIFMNATSLVRDMVTFVHEGGHAVHSIVTKDLPLNAFKHTPSEVAELASMSMELISMDNWDVFFNNEEDLIRAKKEHLAQIIDTLPWVATIDEFQHRIYEEPDATPERHTEIWTTVQQRYSTGLVDWQGYEAFKACSWQKQLHLFEVPFYYIEYGIAQLGAIAVWKNYKENPRKGLQQYLEALKMGNTATIPAIYEKAGIKFDFSADYIASLMQFVQTELDALGNG